MRTRTAGNDGLPPYAIQSVDTALTVLDMLRRDGALSISAAADELDVARSTAHRILSTLRYRGFVDQLHDHKYVPGPMLLQLHRSATPEAVVVGVARPHLVRLAADVDETVSLAVLVGAEVHFVDSVEGRRHLRVGSRVGVHRIARCTAVGRALLADLTCDEVAALYPDLTQDRRTELEHALSADRRRGHVTIYAECEPGVTAIGKTIDDGSGAAIAAVSIAAPIVRYRDRDISGLLPQLTATVVAIRDQLEPALRTATRTGQLTGP